MNGYLYKGEVSVLINLLDLFCDVPSQNSVLTLTFRVYNRKVS